VANPSDDDIRGRSGRPAQPFDTEIRWDPGLTIGHIATTRTNYSVDLPIQYPSSQGSSVDLHLTQRSDSTVLQTNDKPLETVRSLETQDEDLEEIKESLDDEESFDLAELKRHNTTESEGSEV